MVGGGLGLFALVAYALFSWLFAPAALIALLMHGRKAEAVAFLCAIALVWLGRSAVSDIGPIHEVTFRLLALATVAWALMLAQFVLPIMLIVRIFDIEGELSWLFAGRPFGWLLVADSVVVWFLAKKRWLIPEGTETALLVGAIAVAIGGLAILDRSQSRAS